MNFLRFSLKILDGQTNIPNESGAHVLCMYACVHFFIDSFRRLSYRFIEAKIMLVSARKKKQRTSIYFDRKTGTCSVYSSEVIRGFVKCNRK